MLKFASGIKHVDVATPKSIADPGQCSDRLQLYQLLNTPIPATITRFHMTAQTTLSAAAPAPQEEPRLQWHRHSCLCAVAGPGSPRLATPSTSLPVNVLIANLELKLNLSHRKLNPLKIPNRKFLTIFETLFTAVRSSPPAHHKSLPTRHSSPIPPFLIHGTAIKTPPNPLKT